MRMTGVVLVVVASAVVFAPFLIVRKDHAAWNGADGQVTAVVEAAQPEYRPWVATAWKPPSTEIESLLFSLQAALGAGALGYVLGWIRGRAWARLGVQGTEHP